MQARQASKFADKTLKDDPRFCAIISTVYKGQLTVNIVKVDRVAASLAAMPDVKYCPSAIAQLEAVKEWSRTANCGQVLRVGPFVTIAVLKDQSSYDMLEVTKVFDVKTKRGPSKETKSDWEDHENEELDSLISQNLDDDEDDDSYDEDDEDEDDEV